MRKVILLVAVMGLLIFASTSAFAVANFWFAQDDFTLLFGTTGQPGSANGIFNSQGYLKDWTVNSNVAWFAITGSNTAGAALVGSQSVTLYDNTTMTLYTGVKGNIGLSTMLWQGSGSITTIVNSNGSSFSPPVRPAYETQPVMYQGVGYGGFTQTFTNGGIFTSTSIAIDWLGSYNWGYDNGVGGSFGPTSTMQTGNLQARTSAVPEPMSILLGIMGLSSIAGFRKLRKK